MIAEEYVETIHSFLTMLNQIDGVWASLQDDLQQADLETSDILHEIELINFAASDGYCLAKRLKRVRQRRRQVKNEKELLNYIKQWTDQHQHLRLTLHKVCASLRQRQEVQGTRQYTPRVPR